MIDALILHKKNENINCKNLIWFSIFSKWVKNAKTNDWVTNHGWYHSNWKWAYCIRIKVTYVSFLVLRLPHLIYWINTSFLHIPVFLDEYFDLKPVVTLLSRTILRFWTLILADKFSFLRHLESQTVLISTKRIYLNLFSCQLRG